MYTESIGVIGYGVMGASIAQQIKRAHHVFIFDADKAKTAQPTAPRVASSLKELFSSAGTLVIAVKPQDLFSLLRQARSVIDKHLLISIAAGARTSDIQAAFAPKKIKLIRVMPNLFVRDARAVTALCKGRYAKKADLLFAKALFDDFGKTRIIDEEKMDAVTVISGSGPGYLSYLIEKDGVPPAQRSKYIEDIVPEYIEAAKNVGLDAEEARFFSVNTAKGLMFYFQTHPESPEAFRKQVTSKGGTTEAAIKVLEAGGRQKLNEAIVAAFKRAKEIANSIHNAIKENKI